MICFLTLFFLKGDFFGQTYNPILLYSDKSTIELIEYIFEQNVDFQKVKETKEYKNVCQKFENFKWLLDSEILRMLEEKKDYKNPAYTVQQGMIGYKEFDGVTTSISYGYKTQFAYIKEKKRISPEQYAKHLGIRVVCGRFSYIEIARHFNLIMGVSGTLTSLTNTQKEILKVFKINKFSFAPSMFEKAKLSFYPDRDFLVFKQEAELFQKIAINADEEIKKGRAVLVFFETQEKLFNFKESEYYKPFTLIHNEITPLTEYKDKLIRIRKATRSSQVTLLTREFGRGIDFLCLDKNTVKAGGVHVIQTFFSEDISEETQIKGRTGRQEQKGSFSLFIPFEFCKNIDQEYLALDLEKKRYDKILELLEKNRLKEFEKDTNKTLSNMKEVLPLHEKSMKLKGCIFDPKNYHSENKKKNETNTVEILKVFNPSLVSFYHIIFVLDCSGSMGSNVKGINGEERRWDSLKGAVETFLKVRVNESARDLVSIIEFDGGSHIECQATPLSPNLHNKLIFHAGGTSFSAGLSSAYSVMVKLFFFKLKT